MVVAVAEGAGQKFVSTGKKDSPPAKISEVITIHASGRSNQEPWAEDRPYSLW